MEKLQCIKMKNRFLIINLDTLYHKYVSIKQMKQMINDSDLMNEFVKQLDGKPYQKRLTPLPRNKTVGVHLMPTYACNYKCSYCYQNKRKMIKNKMIPESIFKIDTFYTEYNKAFGTDFKPESIFITGGEPFLPSNRNIMETIFTHWKDKEIRLTTNGSCINQYQDLLKKHNLINLTVSVDGIKEIHYKKRIPTSVNQYDEMMDGIKWAISIGIKVRISCLFYPEYINFYPSFYNKMEQIGWLKNPNVSVTFSNEMPGIGPDSIDPNYLENVLSAFIQLKKIDSRTINVDAHSLMPGNLQSSLNKEETDGSFYPYKCEPLLNPSYAFTPDGSVKVCCCIESELGNIGRYWPDVEINVPRITEISKRRIDQLTHCKNCLKRVFCMGGCLATVLDKTDDLLGTYCGIWENPTFLNHLEEFWE